MLKLLYPKLLYHSVSKQNVVPCWCKLDDIHCLKPDLEFHVTVIQVQNKGLSNILVSLDLYNDVFQCKKATLKNSTYCLALLRECNAQAFKNHDLFSFFREKNI